MRVLWGGVCLLGQLKKESFVKVWFALDDALRLVFVYLFWKCAKFAPLLWVFGLKNFWKVGFLGFLGRFWRFFATKSREQSLALQWNPSCNGWNLLCRWNRSSRWNPKNHFLGCEACWRNSNINQQKQARFLPFFLILCCFYSRQGATYKREAKKGDKQGRWADGGMANSAWIWLWRADVAPKSLSFAPKTLIFNPFLG